MVGCSAALTAAALKSRPWRRTTAPIPGRFRLRTYPTQDVQGNIWVYVGAEGSETSVVPIVPGFVDKPPQVSVTMRFPCGVDMAASGFFDPGHPAFVHTSRWWKRNPAARLRLKAKEFAPDGMGFRMARHHLKEGANPYRLLGRNVRVDINIQLPGVRIEHIQGDRHSASVLAAATPVSATETDVHYCVYWSFEWLAAFRPFAAWMTRDFLDQDRVVAARLMSNLAPPPPLFVGDPDAQVAVVSAVEEGIRGRPRRRPTIRQSAPGTDAALAELSNH